MIRRERLLAPLIIVAVVAGAGACTRRGGEASPTSGPTSEAPSGAPSEAPSEAPSSTPPDSPSPPPESPEVPLRPAAAEALGGETLLAAGVQAADSDWRTEASGDWGAEERPVYVAEATIEDRRHVDADVTIAFRADRDMDELRLRFLPAARVLADAGADVTVEVARDGEPVEAQIDSPGARVLVPLRPPLRSGDAAVVRVRVGYDVVDRADLAEEDRGPAGFGLLARSADVTTLGHWLPLLTIPTDDGPMVEEGDVGAFPTAVWSVVVHADGLVVTGGDDRECPDDIRGDVGCVWGRGAFLRDVSAAAFDDAIATTEPVGLLTINAIATGDLETSNAQAAAASAASAASFISRFGPLPWGEIDVLAVPLQPGAAGMEFPGILFIDTETYDTMQGGFGEFVVAHEVAHQWFHALLGNGSLSNPVVDESLAQYASYLYLADQYGDDVAEEFAEGDFLGRYEESLCEGLVDAPPARPLAEFAEGAYGPLVYGRAAYGWVAAEREAGREVVERFIADLVREHGLEFVTGEQVLELAREHDAALGTTLGQWWSDESIPSGSACD